MYMLKLCLLSFINGILLSSALSLSFFPLSLSGFSFRLYPVTVFFLIELHGSVSSKQKIKKRRKKTERLSLFYTSPNFVLLSPVSHASTNCIHHYLSLLVMFCSSTSVHGCHDRRAHNPRDAQPFEDIFSAAFFFSSQGFEPFARTFSHSLFFS